MVRFIFIILLSFVQFNSVIANAKIVFLDMNKVMATSVAGLSILKQLNEINKKNLKVFQEEEKLLKDKEDKLISQKNILSVEDFNNKVKNLKIEINKYNKNKNKILTSFQNMKIDNTNKLLKLMNPILLKYSDENSISIILQKKDLVVGKIELDITDKVIKVIDSNIKVFKIN